MGEREKNTPNDGSTQENVGAEPGQGPGEAPSSDSPKKRRRHVRGRTALTAELQALARLSGEVKIAPDTTAVERHYARSLRIREFILEFLKENAGSTWADVRELYARAANFCDPICAESTAERWIHQYTRVGAPFKLVEGLGYVILERRDR